MLHSKSKATAAPASKTTIRISRYSNFIIFYKRIDTAKLIAAQTDDNSCHAYRIKPHTENPTEQLPEDLPMSGAAKLSHLGVIRAQGEDAAKFLQGQLTNDFVLLGVNESRLAAYCSPKGRMLASFIGFKIQR